MTGVSVVVDAAAAVSTLGSVGGDIVGISSGLGADTVGISLGLGADTVGISSVGGADVTAAAVSTLA